MHNALDVRKVEAKHFSTENAQQSAHLHDIWWPNQSILGQGQDVYQNFPLVLQITAGALTALLLGIQPPQRHVASTLHASRQDALQQRAADQSQPAVG